MRMRMRFLATFAVVVVGLLGISAPTNAASPTGDSVTVDKVLIDRLGGVSVAGKVSCEGTLAMLEAGKLAYAWEEDGTPVFIPVPSENELVNLLANTDNYTVTQPVGRKTMLQVTHGSSQMTPCVGQYPFDPEGTAWAERYVCDTGGFPCPWETNVFNYDRDTFGPLFDYALNGAFKTGKVNVTGHSVGLLVMIYDTVETTWRSYFIEEGTYVPYFVTLRATSYR